MCTTENVAVRTLGATVVVMLSALSAACVPEPFGPTEVRVNLSETAGSGAILIGAGDIAGCDRTQDELTADLVDSLLLVHPTATVFTAGDNVYPDGTAQEYADCYEPSWGRFKDRTWVTLGNHEYGLGNADASFDYFGARLGPRDLGYYSLDVGSWHLVMLNTGDRGIVPVDAGSAQEQWLRTDLAATTQGCVMAVIHDPRFYSCGSSGCGYEKTWVKPFWDALYEYHADVVVSGDRHHYERFALQDPDGNLDPSTGIRLFIVGTGGRGVGTPTEFPHPNVEVVNDQGANGVMKFTLHANSYEWEFVPIAGPTFTDAGTGTCVGGAIADFTWTENPLFTVAFTDASNHPNGTVVAWSWDFGDGATSMLQHPTHTYASGGDYFVSLTVTGNDSTAGTTTKSVPVGPQPPAVTITAPADASTYVEGDLITFSGTATDTEDGDLTASLAWSSNLDGAIGAGGSVPVSTLSAGTHAITASATDSGGLEGSDTITVTVDPEGLMTVNVRVAASTDDAEERASGSMYLTSSDLELVYDQGDQQVGMRFTGVAIPQGATILDAYVQFQVDEALSGTTSLTIAGEATDNAVTFGLATGDISSRSRTGAAVPWTPEPWLTVGEAGLAQRTPDLTTVIQEIVDRTGWASGNSLVLIITGAGERVAEAYDGVPAAAPLLHVEFLTGPPSPTTDAGTSTVTTNVSIVPADGTSTATITVTLLDAASAPVVGHSVSLAQDGGSSTISAPSGPSDATGHVTFTVTSTTPEPVTYTATDDTDGVAITQTAQVTFTALPTDAGTSTVTATPTAVPPDGTTPATITVTLLNSVNAPVVGHVVSLAQGAGSSTISPASGPSDATGHVTFTVTSTTAEPVVYTATDDTDGVTITQTAQVIFTALPTDAGTSTVTATPAAVPADGTTAATITVTLLDAASAPVAGHSVSLAQGGGSSTISAPSGPSDATGHVTFTVTSTTPEPVTYTATDDTDGVAITQTAQVTFTALPTDAGTSTVTATPTAVPPDGTTPATVTVTLLNSVNAPVIGHTVSLAQGTGSSTISPASGPSDVNGHVTFTVTNETVEAVTYTATDDTDGVTITQTAQVTFAPLPTDAGTSTVTASAPTVPSDGTTTATITVTLLDALNAPVVGHTVSLAQGGGSSTISAPSGPSDATGHVTFTVTSTTPEPVAYTATDDTDGVTITQTAQVTFTALPTDAGTSTVTATPAAVPADGTTAATITVTLLDAASAPVAGHSVSLAQGGGSSTITAPSGPSDATGHVTFTVTSTTAEPVTYTATDDTYGVTITQTAQVTFTALPTDAGTSTVTATPAAVPADGTSTATITVTLLDAASAPVVGHSVSLAQGGGSSTISAPSGPSDVNGHVTFTVTSTAAEALTYTATDDTDGVTITQTAEVTFDAVPSVPGTIDVRVAASSDDAEELVTGSMYLTSSDLELVYDRGGDQTVGMRFNGITIPRGATILDAYVQFQVDVTASGPTSLTIEGEATDKAVTFGTATGDISARNRTSAAVPWVPAPWVTSGEAGPDQRTPNLAAVIQEIVNRGGWASGNSLAIIITGTGERVADSFDGAPASAPLLHVEFLTGPPPPPTDAGNSTVTATPSAVPADGTSSATITVTLLDGSNTPMVGHTVSLAQTGNSVIAGPSGLSDASGQVNLTVTNTTAEAVTYTATDDTDGVTITQTVQVTFSALPTEAGTSTATATPTTVPPDGTTPATITVTLLNSVGVPVVGHAVSLAQGTGSSSISPASGPSDASGRVTFTVTNTTQETVTYTATDDTDGVTIAQTAQVTFDPTPPTPSVIDVRVAASSDDAEELVTGSMYLTSSDLELVYDRGGDQTVGMRFNGLAIPQAATILDAYVQFQVDVTASGPTSLTIEAEATDNAVTFGTATGDISSRSRTSAAAPWAPAPWATSGEAGPDQRTPNLAAVIQEIVNRGGWASGNSLAIIITGTGERVADSFDGGPASAPLLHVEFTN